MKAKRLVKNKKIFFLIIFMLALLILSNTSNIKAYTVTHTQTKRQEISSFPESYKAALQELSNNHPNWNFTALYTGMTWEEFINSESAVHLRNRVHNSSEAAWKCSCNQSSGGYACASRSILEYFADPRNFLTEDRNIPIYGNVLQFICSKQGRGRKYTNKYIYEWKRYSFRRKRRQFCKSKTSRFKNICYTKDY